MKYVIETMITVDDLAQIIREVDGNHDLGAGALAEKLLDRLGEPHTERTWIRVEITLPTPEDADSNGDVLWLRSGVEMPGAATGYPPVDATHWTWTDKWIRGK